MQLRCPICKTTINDFDPMLEHLIKEHDISKHRAKFLTKKLVEWRHGTLDPTLFRRADLERTRSILGIE